MKLKENWKHYHQHERKLKKLERNKKNREEHKEARQNIRRERKKANEKEICCQKRQAVLPAKPEPEGKRVRIRGKAKV